MAIQLEFINVIVPVQRICDLYSGGWVGWLSDCSPRIGKTVWWDRALVRAGGCMDAELIDDLVKKWTHNGFQATQTVDGNEVWKDFCIVDASGITQFDCPWLVVRGTNRIAWLRGTEPDRVVGRGFY